MKKENLKKVIKIIGDDFTSSKSKYFGAYAPKGGEDFLTRFNKSLEKVIRDYKQVEDITPIFEYLYEAFKASI